MPSEEVPNSHQILSAEEMSRALARMAHQLVEQSDGADDVTLLGIPTRGLPLAQRLAAQVASITGHEVPVGTLDVTMYRDDLRKNPTRAVHRTQVPADLEGRPVVLVDDVLNSGRTVLSALDALKDLGRPSRVMLAVLVDRGHREVPVQADVVGLSLRTSTQERVSVHLTEVDGTDQVTIARPTNTQHEDRSGEQR